MSGLDCRANLLWTEKIKHTRGLFLSPVCAGYVSLIETIMENSRQLSTDLTLLLHSLHPTKIYRGLDENHNIYGSPFGCLPISICRTKCGGIGFNLGSFEYGQSDDSESDTLTQFGADAFVSLARNDWKFTLDVNHASRNLDSGDDFDDYFPEGATQVMAYTSDGR